MLWRIGVGSVLDVLKPSLLPLQRLHQVQSDCPGKIFVGMDCSKTNCSNYVNSGSLNCMKLAVEAVGLSKPRSMDSGSGSHEDRICR